MTIFTNYAPFESDEPHTGLKLDYSSPLGDLKTNISYSFFLLLACWLSGLMDLFTLDWHAGWISVLVSLKGETLFLIGQQNTSCSNS